MDTAGKDNDFDIKTVLLKNSRMLCNIQTQVTELNATSKRLEERMQKLENERSEDRDNIMALQEHCCENRESINFLHDTIKDTQEMVKNRDSLTDDKLTVINTNHSNLLENVQKLTKEQQSHAQYVKQIEQVMNEKGYELPQRAEFGTDVTVVASGVLATENEDLDRMASNLIHNKLGLSEVKIVRTKCMSTWRNGKGLVKIEVDSADHAKTVVQNKRQL